MSRRRRSPAWPELDLRCNRPRPVPPKRSSSIAFFAGIWTSWIGERGSQRNRRTGEHELFGFLTYDANEVVKPIHRKAMPVILTTLTDIELWMTGEL